VLAPNSKLRSQGSFAFDQTGGFDSADPEPIPEFEFDQSLPG